MAELRHTCPDCGSIDVVVSKIAVAADAHCPNCDWNGPGSETIGVASREQFWDIERVGAVLLRVISRWGAGPMCQVFEFVGLIEKDDQKARNRVMQEATAACIQAAFEAAHAVHLEKLMATPEEELGAAERKLVRAAKKREEKRKRKQN